MEYTESYTGLCHGTDKESAEKIISDGFLISDSSNNVLNWCGKGVYFYDIKAKAWWSANRKCREIKKKEVRDVKSAIILADIKEIFKKDIFDLRVKKELDTFEMFVRQLFDGESQIDVSGIINEADRKIVLRTILISCYADENNKKLVIGNFRQRPQPLYEHAIEFANSLNMVFGIETIYCVKDISIIKNIRWGGVEK